MEQPTRFPYKEMCGSLHLHTTYSDGGVDYPQLIDAAHEVGLDYIIVTDHMSLGGLKDGFEGIQKNVIVVVGYEHNDAQNLNHYLAIGVPEVFSQKKNPQEYIDAVRNAGGIGFIAHPAEKRNYLGQFPPYPWTEWDVQGYDGLELWNQMSEWIEQLKSWGSIVRLLYPRRFLQTAPPELLEMWDKLNQHRFTSGIGGVDAHTRRVGKGLCSLIVFPIKVELKGIRTHVYLPEITNSNDFEMTKKALLNSLKNGHAFISNFRRGDAKGTKIFSTNKNGDSFPPGKWKNSLKPNLISISLPEKAEIRLIHNGKTIKKDLSKIFSHQVVDNGVYRFEVYRKNKAWIYSNPFCVGI